MIKVQSFTFNPFQENTYILWDDSNECIVIDPGCYEEYERKELAEFIASNNLKPVRLINTHCHIDHVFGNAFVAESYNLDLEIHKLEIPILAAVERQGQMFGINVIPSPEPGKFIEKDSKIEFGNSELDVIFVPGHAPGHIALVSNDDEFVIAGDVLFLQSIGRTDLPGGNHDQLIQSIKEEILTLGDKFRVYPGHGPSTTVGFEKTNNPFF